MPMTVSKTRDMLVDVARQLFARMGVDNTTMNDIAQASRKGRRTLYTYFKSKNEIYLAVVESELDQLHKMLVDVASKDLPADEKLLTFIYSRLDAVKALVFRNGTLRATFFRDIWRVEKVRKLRPSGSGDHKGNIGRWREGGYIQHAGHGHYRPRAPSCLERAGGALYPGDHG